MKTLEWNWTTSDGLQVYSQDWVPDKKIKAALCLIHGHGEHVGRYAHVGAALAKDGYALLGFDLRGHGKTQGQRGHTPSCDILMDDVAMFLRESRRRYPDIPCYLYGHSMGGTLVLNCLLRRKVKCVGAVVTGAWLRLAFEPPAIKMFLGKMMNNLMPGFTQPSGLETAALSRDPNVVQAYVDDPLVHDKISARLFMCITESGRWALEHASEFNQPILLLHGSADRIVSVEAVEEFARKVGKKATLKIWEGWYHEIHNEPDQEKVFKVITDWLDKQSK